MSESLHISDSEESVNPGIVLQTNAAMTPSAGEFPILAFDQRCPSQFPAVGTNVVPATPEAELVSLRATKPPNLLAQLYRGCIDEGAQIT